MMLPQYVTDTGWVEEPVVIPFNRRLGILELSTVPGIQLPSLQTF